MKSALARRVAICVVVLVFLIAGNAKAVTFINNCTKITQPGSYFLITDITATTANVVSIGAGEVACIAIASDFVTLDLGGHTILGGGVAHCNGISTIIFASPSPQGISVHSGVVAKFILEGVRLDGAGHTVENIRAINNASNGINVGNGNGTGSNGHRIANNVSINNGFAGIFVTCPAVVTGNVTAGNPVTIDFGNSGNRTGCTLAENAP